eukprot:scaffold44533_cov36-Phaeocystis_antarctica.AAC.1
MPGARHAAALALTGRRLVGRAADGRGLEGLALRALDRERLTLSAGACTARLGARLRECARGRWREGLDEGVAAGRQAGAVRLARPPELRVPLAVRAGAQPLVQLEDGARQHARRGRPRRRRGRRRGGRGHHERQRHRHRRHRCRYRSRCAARSG